MRRAVLPAAGRGTRLGAIARDGAKELVSVAGRALVEHALADLAASGIAEALIVTSPRKPMLAAMLGSRAQGVALSYVVQEEPRGLADALSLAEEFVAGEPFLCWLPDNLWSGRRPAAAQLLDAFGRAPRAHVVALLQIAAADVLRHGAAGFVETAPSSAGPDLARIVRVLGKGARPPLPSDPAGTLLKGFPLDLWQPDLFDRIRALRARSPPGELDDTPILQELAAEGRLFGAVLRDGRLFDCGIPEGLAAAREAFGDEGA